MIISVTKEHILHGEQQKCMSCPVALALKDHGYPTCRVTHYFIILSTVDTKTCYKWISLPSKVSLFITDFDAGIPVEPFTFEIPDNEVVSCPRP